MFRRRNLRFGDTPGATDGTWAVVGWIFLAVIIIAVIIVSLTHNPGSPKTGGGDTPGGDTPGGDTAGGDTGGGDTPGGDTPGGDTPEGDRKPLRWTKCGLCGGDKGLTCTQGDNYRTPTGKNGDRWCEDITKGLGADAEPCCLTPTVSLWSLLGLFGSSDCSHDCPNGFQYSNNWVRYGGGKSCVCVNKAYAKHDGGPGNVIKDIFGKPVY